MRTVKEQAAALRIGLLGGYASVADAVVWADGLIMEDRIAEVPQVLDLCLLHEDQAADAIALLGEVPGEADEVTLGREAAGIIYERLASGRLDVVAAARAMCRLQVEGLSPDSEFWTKAYYFDDAADLAARGMAEPVDELRREMLAFLRRYVGGGSSPEPRSPEA